MSSVIFEMEELEGEEENSPEAIVKDQEYENFNSTLINTVLSRNIGEKERKIQKLNSDLLNSIETADIETFHRCLRDGASVNATCRGVGVTACHVAVLCDRCYLLGELLQQGADDSLPSWQQGYFPIHIATWKECLTCLKLLVNRTSQKVSAPTRSETDISSINLITVDSWEHNHKLLYMKMPSIVPGSTPLHIACKKLNLELIEYLLEEKANAEYVDSRGMTPFDVVNESIMMTSSNDRGSQRKSMLAVSSCKSHYSNSMSTINEFHKHEVIDPIDNSAELERISKIILLLIDHNAGFKITESNRKCTSLLHPAVITKNEKLLKILLNQNVDLYALDDLGDTALHLAVRHRLKISLLTLLKCKKVKNILETTDREGKTALQIAVCAVWNEGASALLEVGASVTAVTSQGDTVLHLAARTTNIAIIEGLFTYQEIHKVKDKKNMNGETAIMVAVLHNNLECVRKLFDFGVSLRLTGENNRTLTHAAAEKGYENILKLIVREDPDLLRAKTNDNETALHLAASSGYLECVRFLLAEGCDETAITIKMSSSFDESFDFGGTPLHNATWKGHLPVIRSLIDHNPSLVNLANINKWYPLHVAIYFNHPECADYLIQHGGVLSYKVPYANDCFWTGFDLLSYTFNDAATFLEKVFDSFIESCDLPLNHPDCCITFKFNALAPYRSNGEIRRQMKVLNALLNTEDELLQRQVLLHPLIEMFLHMKWKKLEIFFVVITILYAIFTFTLTTFALLVNHETFRSSSEVSRAFLIVMTPNLLVLVAQEILHARKLRLYYIKDLESWVKCSTYGTTCIVGLIVVDSTLFGRDYSHLTSVLAVPVLLSWIEVLFLLSRYPRFGHCFLMFVRVMSTVLKVFCTFTPLILGFVFSFYILFKGQENSPFYSLLETFTKVIVMMFEFDYSSTFPNSSDSVFDVVSRMIFLLFVVLVATVLMNLMIGYAVSDIATLKAQGRSQMLAKQINFLYVLETLVYNENLLNCLPHKLMQWVKENRNVANTFTMFPGQPWDTKFKMLPAMLKQIILKKISIIKQEKPGK